MMINSKKILGMLFVGLAMMIADPSLGWAEEAVDINAALKDAGAKEDVTYKTQKEKTNLSALGAKVLTRTAQSTAMGTMAGSAFAGVGAAPGAAIGAAVGVTTGTLEYFLLKNEETIGTYTDKDNRTYKFKVVGDQYMYNEGSFIGCEILPVKLYKQRRCFFCPLFAVIYRAADKMAVTSFSALAASFAAIIGLGLAIYVAFQTLTHLSSLTKQDAPKFLGTLMRQIFKFLIAFFLLMYANEIYDRIVNPILEGGLEFGQVALTQASVCLDGEEVNTTLYKPELYAKLECFVTNVQKEIAFMQSIGTSLMCIGGNAMMALGGEGIDFGDGFWMALQGAVIGCFGFLLSLAFAFYLIDAVVQLGIVGALMPFLIASWPFKMTSKYASTGFNMILNSFFVFVFIGLVVSVNFALIDAALKSGAQDAQVSAQVEELGANLGGLQGLYDAINLQDHDAVAKLTDISGMGFIILLICCIFGFKFCGQSSALAEKMASGGLKGIGSSIGTMAASAAVSTAKKVTKPLRSAISDRVDSAVKAAPGAILGGTVALFKGKKGKDNKKKDEGEGGDNPTQETPKPRDVPNPEKSTTENQQVKKSGPTSVGSNEPLNKDGLKDEFAQTDLSKNNDREIAQSKQKETQARQNQAAKTKSATEKKAQLAEISDQNSPEAKALAKDIRRDEKEAKDFGKEANKEMRGSKKLQKQNNVMEKAYTKARKNGCTIEKAREIAAEAANSLNQKDVNKKQRYDK